MDDGPDVPLSPRMKLLAAILYGSLIFVVLGGFALSVSGPDPFDY